MTPKPLVKRIEMKDGTSLSNEINNDYASFIIDFGVYEKMHTGIAINFNKEIVDFLESDGDEAFLHSEIKLKVLLEVVEKIKQIFYIHEKSVKAIEEIKEMEDKL